MSKKKKQKKSAKTEKPKSEPPQTGEQMDLIDVHPENEKEILQAAKAYKTAQKERLAALAAETEQKQRVLELVKAAGFQPSPDGSIKFKLDGVKISVTPRDELITVKCDEEAEAA